MITNEKSWKEYVNKNTDPYGKCCVDIAREAMKILDDGKEFDCHNLILTAEKVSGENGITGYMAGAIAQMISQCHSRGDEFRKKWNKGYGVEEDKPGVVNPAILIMDKKGNEP